MMSGGVTRVALLGATGSIGGQALEVIRRHRDAFRVVALTAHSSAEALLALDAEFAPEFCALTHPHAGFEAPDRKRWALGTASLVDAARHPEADVVLNAVVGAAGLEASLAAVAAGKRLLLANKESLVAGGALIMGILRRGRGEIIPVDSEHTAIFQCLRDAANPPEGLILTASGGPLRQASRRDTAEARPGDVLKHPVWSMGKKITVDSATMMNKGLEVIEAHWLFSVPEQCIEVVVHPQSIVHSAVRFADGAVLAQMGTPDMAGPIAYALSYPKRLPGVVAPLDLTAAALTFEPPDETRFPCLRLAREALRLGGMYPAVLNAANEEAVAGFLQNAYPLGGIAERVEEALSAYHGPSPAFGLGEVLEADAWARRFVKERKCM